MNANNRKAQNNGKYRQILAAMIVNLLSVSSGITWGWPSPVLPQLRSSNPPVGEAPMSEDKISWIGGLMAIGGLSIVSFCGVLSERIGRKKFALLTGLPQIVSWLLIIFGQNHIHLYGARLAGGVGAAMTLFIVPLYISEIATDDIRGSLGSLLLLTMNTGTLFAYNVGGLLPYRLFAYLSIVFPLSFVVLFGFMPETPIYLVRKNRLLQARKSLMFFRGNNEVLVEQELMKLRSQANGSKDPSKKIQLSGFLKDRATRKGLIISFGLLGAQQLSGIFALVSYVETIFKSAESCIPPVTATIIIGVLQILGSNVSTMLMERAGRRILILVSCVTTAIAHSIGGLYFCLQQHKYDVHAISWMPLLSISVFVISFCLGLGPVPFVITAELFRPDVSSSAVTLCYIFYWIISFVSIQTFVLAVTFLGIGGGFLLLASFCVGSFVFAYCVVPETKAREIQDIVAELAGIDSRRELRGAVADKNDANADLLTDPA